MIVLDASLLIGHLAIDDSHRTRAFDILDTEEDLSIHPLTLAEVLVRPARDGREAAVLASIDLLGIERAQPPLDEALELARLRSKTGLRLPACCVLATAEREGATLATFDTRLASIARSRGVEVVGS